MYIPSVVDMLEEHNIKTRPVSAADESVLVVCPQRPARLQGHPPNVTNASHPKEHPHPFCGDPSLGIILRATEPTMQFWK